MFGQLVIGPPGSGKSTYIKKVNEYYTSFKRKTITINLDPANDDSLYDVDIKDLISMEDVGERLKLGPNASIIYIFDFLKANIEWLLSKISKESYYLIDTPGQTELFCLSQSFKDIIHILTKGGLSLCVVNLIECNNISDISNYIFSTFSVLNSMIQLELPQVNVLSKIDLLKSFSFKNKNLSIELINQPDNELIKSLLDEQMEDSQNKKSANRLHKLNGLISDFITDYSLVSYSIMDVNNNKHLNKISYLADRANGYSVDEHGGGADEVDVDVRSYIAKLDVESEVLDEMEDRERYLLN